MADVTCCNCHDRASCRSYKERKIKRTLNGLLNAELKGVAFLRAACVQLRRGSVGARQRVRNL